MADKALLRMESSRRARDTAWAYWNRAKGQDSPAFGSPVGSGSAHLGRALAGQSLVRVDSETGCVRTQVEVTALRPHNVRFVGPALDRRIRGALSAAGVSVLERHPCAEWGPQRQTYLVSLEARDPADAIRRVEEALEGQGAYAEFSAELRV